jgi:hypothetical protein
MSAGVRIGRFELDSSREAVFAPGQRHHFLALQHLGEQVFAHFALRQGIHGLAVGDQERHREEVEFLDLRRPVDGRTDGEVDHALANRGEFARLVAADQRGAWIHLDVDAALGLFLDQFRPAFAGLAPGEGRAEHGRQPVFGLVVLRHGRQGQDQGGNRNEQRA